MMQEVLALSSPGGEKGALESSLPSSDEHQETDSRSHAVQEVALRALPPQEAVEPLAGLMGRCSLMPEQDQRGSGSRLSPFFRSNQKPCDSPVEASIREEIRNNIHVYAQSTTASLAWAFTESQFRDHLLPLVREKVLPKFPSLFLDAYDRKFVQIFTYELKSLRDIYVRNLGEYIEKEVVAFLHHLFEGKRECGTRYHVEEECVRALSAPLIAAHPSWLANVFETRRRIRESFAKTLSQQSECAGSFLKQFADKWLHTYYEGRVPVVDESQEEIHPDFGKLVEEGQRVLRASFPAFLVDELHVRDTLRGLYEAALRKRPSQYLMKLIEHTYFERKPECPYAGAIEACEAAFYRRFPGRADPALRQKIQKEFDKIKQERVRQLHLFLRNTVEGYLNREMLLEEERTRKSLDEEIEELLLEAFSDNPLPEERLQDVVFTLYIENKAKKWNQHCRSLLGRNTLYPFVFPDKKEELHQRLYAQFLDFVAHDMVQDFGVRDPRSEEWWRQVTKIAHDALNECIRQAAREKPH